MNNKFSSNLSIVAILVTCVIGIGSFFRFPFEVNKNGGAIFIFLYLFAVLFISVPTLFAELVIGKNGRRDAVRSIEKLDIGKKRYSIAAKIGIFSSFILITFISIIGSWSLIYLYEGILYGYDSYLPETASIVLAQRINSFSLCLFTQAVFIFLVVVKSTFDSNIILEKGSIILKFAIILMMILIFLYSITLRGFNKSLQYLFIPNIDYMEGSIFNIVLSAIRQSLFTFTLGTGVIITYGMYIKGKENVANITLKVVGINTTLSIIFVVVVFTILNSFSISYGDTENVMFISVLVLSAQSQIGRIIGCLFFFVFFISTLLMASAMLQTIVLYFTNISRVEKRIVSIVIGVILVTISVLLQPKLNVHINFFSWAVETKLRNQTIDLAINVLIPISVIITSLFTGFKLNPVFIEKEFKNKRIANIFILYMRYVLPTILSIVFIINFLSVVG